ncbi:MAG: PPC domain-containing protein [Massilia sp.]
MKIEKFLPCLLACFLAGAQPAHAASYEAALKNAAYVVTSGDVNGDGQNDVLFIAKPKLVPIPIDDDLYIPVFVPPSSPSFALVSSAFGVYTLVPNPDSTMLSSAAWKPATQKISFTGGDGVYADTVVIAPGADTQAGFKVGLSNSGNLELISTTPPVVDPTLPPGVSAVYAMSNYMKGAQQLTLFTKAPNGDRLAVWTSDDASRTSMLKRWDAAGTVLGSEENFVLGTNVLSISANKTGGFLVLRKLTASGVSRLVAYRYTRDGQLVTTFQVNSLAQQLVSPDGRATLYDDGSFAAFYLTSTDTVPAKLWFNRFQADGSPINQFGRDVGYQTRINGLASDQHLVGLTIMSYLTPSSNGVNWGTSSHIRSFWSNAIFSPSVDVGQKYHEDVAMNRNGTYVTTWSTGFDAYARKFSVDGTGGPVVHISSTLVAGIGEPKAVVFDNGSYAVTWLENINGAFTLKTRLVDENGTIAGAETVVATGLRNYVPFAVGTDPSGSYTVAWTSEGPVVNATYTKDVLMRDFAAATMPTVTPLQSGVAVENLAGAANSMKYYKIVVPANKATLKVSLTSQSSRVVGNADLYLSYAQQPKRDTHDTASAGAGSEEAIQVNSPPPGVFYIGVFGAEAYESVRLNATFE